VALTPQPPIPPGEGESEGERANVRAKSIFNATFSKHSRTRMENDFSAMGGIGCEITHIRFQRCRSEEWGNHIVIEVSSMEGFLSGLADFLQWLADHGLMGVFFVGLILGALALAVLISCLECHRTC
jgi:hypothetical protein